VATPFKLDEDKRSDLQRLIRSSSVKDWSKASATLMAGVEGSVAAWSELSELHVTPKGVVQLSGLVALLTGSPQPSIAQIRMRVASLPPGIVRHIEGRALRLSDQVKKFRPIGLSLKTWAQRAAPDDLVKLLSCCLVQGGQFVSGRNRPKGKQSAPRLERAIAARPNTPKNEEGYAGGRPIHHDLQLLVSFLAIDWLLSTGLQPDKGRSDKVPFGALVFMVFGWIGKEDKAAHSLRTYWSSPKPSPKKKQLAALSQG
jgi:hypothetical protein